jgi:hypothetical protein
MPGQLTLPSSGIAIQTDAAEPLPSLKERRGAWAEYVLTPAPTSTIR